MFLSFEKSIHAFVAKLTECSRRWPSFPYSLSGRLREPMMRVSGQLRTCLFASRGCCPLTRTSTYCIRKNTGSENTLLLCLIDDCTCFSSRFQGRIQDFFRRGCTTKEWRNWLVNGRTTPVALENLRSSGGGVRTPCTLPLDPPLDFSPKAREANSKKC